MDVVRDLGCLQLDPISAVARSHLLVLWSRLGVYDLADLDRLIYEDRQLFEYWAHVASIVLTEDYPDPSLADAQLRQRWDGGDAWAQRVRDWIDAESGAARLHPRRADARKGALFSRELEAGRASTRSTGYRAAGRAGATSAGCSISSGRRARSWWRSASGVQKRWDLAERCLPDWTPRDQLGHRSGRRPTRRRNRCGRSASPPASRSRSIIRAGAIRNLPAILKTLEKEGRIVRVNVEDMTGA